MLLPSGGGRVTESALSFMRRLREGLDAGLDLPGTRSPAGRRLCLGTLAPLSSGCSTGWTATTKRTRVGLRRGVRRPDRAAVRLPLRHLVAGPAVGLHNVLPRPWHSAAGGQPRGDPPWDATMVSMAVLGASTRCPATRVSWCSTGPSTFRGSPRPCAGWAEWWPGLQRDAATEQDHRGRLPRGRQGHGVLLRALPAAALRPRRLRGDRAAYGRAHRAGGHSGSEEIYPKLGDLPAVARLLGAPYFPVTPTFLAGPLGVVPLPSRWRIEFEPIPTAAYGPAAAGDRPLVLELSGTRPRRDPRGGLRQSRAPRSSFRLGIPAGARPAAENRGGAPTVSRDPQDSHHHHCRRRLLGAGRRGRSRARRLLGRLRGQLRGQPRGSPRRGGTEGRPRHRWLGRGVAKRRVGNLFDIPTMSRWSRRAAAASTWPTWASSRPGPGVPSADGRVIRVDPATGVQASVSGVGRAGRPGGCAASTAPAGGGERGRERQPARCRQPAAGGHPHQSGDRVQSVVARGEPMCYPFGIAVDRQGRILVSDFGELVENGVPTVTCEPTGGGVIRVNPLQRTAGVAVLQQRRVRKHSSSVQLVWLSSRSGTVRVLVANQRSANAAVTAVNPATRCSSR